MIEITLLEMMLMQYAAGALSPSEALVTAAYVALNPEARRKVAQYEALAGKTLCDTPPARVSQNCFDSVLQKISAPCRTDTATPHTPMMPDEAIPATVMKILCGNCTERKLSWKSLQPGIEAVTLHVPSGSPCRHRLRLIRLAPGQATPPHAHHGREITLVLQGGYSDHTGHYSAGDLVVVQDAHFAHAPKADPEGCLSLTLTEAPLRFRAVHIRILNVFWRF